LDFDFAVCLHIELPKNAALKGCIRGHLKEKRQFIRGQRNAILTISLYALLMSLE
jgi:hypothetical protein